MAAMAGVGVGRDEEPMPSSFDKDIGDAQPVPGFPGGTRPLLLAAADPFLMDTGFFPYLVIAPNAAITTIPSRSTSRVPRKQVACLTYIVRNAINCG